MTNGIPQLGAWEWNESPTQSINSRILSYMGKFCCSFISYIAYALVITEPRKTCSKPGHNEIRFSCEVGLNRSAHAYHGLLHLRAWEWNENLSKASSPLVKVITRDYIISGVKHLLKNPFGTGTG